jgi:hypothetical protein
MSANWSRIFLSAHIDELAKQYTTRKGDPYVRVRLRYNPPEPHAGEAVQYEIETASIAFYAWSQELCAAVLALAVNAPVLADGYLAFRKTRGKKFYVINGKHIELLGDAEEWRRKTHASPIDHQVVGHHRTLANGKVVYVTSHWKGRRVSDPYG